LQKTKKIDYVLNLLDRPDFSVKSLHNIIFLYDSDNSRL
jgi:hypothetical protein